MSRVIIVLAFVVLCAFAPTNGIKCHEGFNMTLNGIPLYFWNERDCTGDSECVGQEIGMHTTVAGLPLQTALRYGACMSRAYADFLSCDKLFGAGSTFDPANLLDLVPGVEESLNNAVEIFVANLSASLQQLLSDGTGMEAFVDGVFTFYESLGFNLAKAVPLKPSLAKLLTATISGSSDIGNILIEFLNEFAQLDTANPAFAAALRSFTTNFADIATIEARDPSLTALIERGPGLLRSIFPSNWEVALWYDVAFELIGDIDIKNWTKSTEDMVATIKSSYQIPADIAQYVNPILDALPDLARGVEVNPAYTGKWSLALLEEFSEVDNATQAFSNALTSLLESLLPLQYEYKATIKWMPGLFYKAFPGDKAVIQEVYMKMADGFNSFDMLNLASTAPETKLSMMIKNVVSTYTWNQTFDTAITEGAFNNALVVNFAKMFYDLMNVTVDYTGYIDTFATVIDDEFKKWPMINVGRMISNLIIGLGGDIPNELKPMLEYIQEVLTVVTAQPFDAENLKYVFKNLTTDYKIQYPESPFPDLGDRLIDIIFEWIAIDYTDYLAALDKQNELNRRLMFWNIDLQFAFVNSIDYSSDQLNQMLVAAWPEYDLFIRVLQAMEADNVKQLITDIISFYTMPPPHTTQGLIDVIKPTFENITNSIENLMSEIRQLVSPDSCRFASCATDLCNNQMAISAGDGWTSSVTPTPTTAPTTSGGNRISFDLSFHIATLWMVAKLFY